MANIKNLEKLMAKLERLRSESLRPSRAVVTGYSQGYAIFVHENLEAHHEVGQAKFLEEPARDLQRVMAQQIKDSVKAGLPLEAAMLKAMLYLQRESQQLVPVDTGALRASAFTCFEDEVEEAAEEARSRGDARRQVVYDKQQKKRLEAQLKKV